MKNESTGMSEDRNSGVVYDLVCLLSTEWRGRWLDDCYITCPLNVRFDVCHLPLMQMFDII